MGEPLTQRRSFIDIKVRRLIARADADVRAGAKVVFVNLTNEIGILEEQFRGPERIAQIGAATFEFRREAAVEDDDAGRVEN